MILNINFDNNAVSYENEGQKGTVIIDDLAERKDAIINALGMELIPMEDIRNEIDDMFAELGFNVKCARPKEEN